MSNKTNKSGQHEHLLNQSDQLHDQLHPVSKAIS